MKRQTRTEKTKKQVLPFFKRRGGEWIAGGAEKPRPLFNLPAVAHAKTVVLVEGEKCAEALVNLGIPATTSVGGASGTKDADWSALAAAEKVYLLPDADMPGEIYIEQASRLIAATNPTAQFFIFRLDGDDGSDIVDWIQAELASKTAWQWDEYSAFPEESVAQLRAALKTALADAPRFFPDISTAETEAELPSRSRSADNYVAEVRDKLSFSSVLAHYHRDGAGKERSNGFTRCKSPFGEDSTPSFDFNEATKMWHCFSSSKGGDIFSLIAELEHISTKGDDWRRVLEVAATITGHARPKQEKPSNVTSLQTKLPLNLDSIAPELYSIPNDSLTPAEALVACEKVLRAVAGSDGVQDEFVFERIKDHFKLTAAFMKPFRAQVRTYREELKATGRIEKTNAPKADSDDPAPAPCSLYFELFPRFLGTHARDIFMGDVLLWDEHEKVYTPAINLIKNLKSQFLRYGEARNVRFSMSALECHFESYCRSLTPRLVFDVPEWDGRDYIAELCQRVTLAPIEVQGLGTIDAETFVDFTKDWHTKMWQKFEDPEVQNRIIVLKGDQGIGKDFFIKEQLGGLGQFLTPMTVESSDKDTRAQLHQGLAVVISEFDRTVKQHASTIKDLLTADMTMVRFAYDARAKPRFARCSFIASCNVDEVLRDSTGNRRFVLFSIESIDKSFRFSAEERLQVLAQGRALAASGYRASARSEALMAAHVAKETPEAPKEALLEEWNEEAQRVFLALSETEQRACKSAAHLGPKGCSGFMPNYLLKADRTFEKLAKAFAWNERYIAMQLTKLKLKSVVKLSRSLGAPTTPERGYFWTFGEVTEGAESYGEVTGNEDENDVDFL